MQKKIIFVILIFILIPITYAGTNQKSNCINKINSGSQAWQVIKYCGKPLETKISIQSATKNKQYLIYEYALNEPICYTQPEQPQVVCNAKASGKVKFYFYNNQLEKAELQNKNINDVFLRYNQKIVLGDTEKDVISLWGQPNMTEKKSLNLPVNVEVWQYQSFEIILINGVVSKISPLE
ncbi:MAG: hypothetical protein CMF49_01710 [Legionellales bacterium]|nr:hypothetical protein [Legionellales bacterium]|tara:strand:- start:400 stop:939 length:540 start_codon:yes stop_codon:yes gene_type:complete